MRAAGRGTALFVGQYDSPGAFLSAPLHDQGGGLIGVAAFGVSLMEINAIMGERNGLGKTGETYLVGPVCSHKYAPVSTYPYCVSEEENHNVVAVS